MQVELELQPGEVIQLGEHLLTVLELQDGEVTFKIWEPDDAPESLPARWQQQPR